MDHYKSIKAGCALFVAILLQCHTLLAQNRVALTFDDLPCLRCEDNAFAADITAKLLKTLSDYKAPAIGFVNESKLYSGDMPDKRRIALLEDWLRQRHALGNHTFSHVWINNTGIAKYQSDILRGEEITMPLTEKYERPLTYFRHPQLRSGPTAEYKAALDSIIALHGYLTAPVTMDNDEYIYAHCYDAARQAGDSASMRLIAYAFLQHMREIIAHYESVSEEFLGYNLPHVLLLHASALVADYLPVLLAEFRSHDYDFISLEEAMQDSAYALPDAVCTRGLSWLKRWQLAAGESIEPQPDVPDDIQRHYEDVRMGNYATHYQPSWSGSKDEVTAIRRRIAEFSAAYINGDYATIADAYTENGKIFPHRAPIISGHQAIQGRWTLPEGVSTLHHVITPLEIEIVGKTAYDYGYYEGSTQYRNGTVAKWVGKYVIVWKKREDGWKIYLDIWNSL